MGANWNDLHEPGALSSGAGLSRTIRHAIILCRELRVPLLWVDALCIQQDGDIGAKLAQIRNMHHIYEGAVFTIVAASGTDAEAGLPGVLGNCERQRRVRVQGLELLPSGNTLDTIIESTTWHKRAWTYQEYL